MTTAHHSHHHRRRRIHRGAAVAALLVVLIVTAGCSTTDGPKEGPPMDPHATLLARPSFEDAVARYQQMQNRIQTELDAALGRHNWMNYDPEGRQDNCAGDFRNEYDGKVLALPQFGFTGGIPDAQWPRAEQIIVSIINQYGFDTTGLVKVDKPGRHELNAKDPELNAYFSFGAEVNTVVQTTTGCHLPAAKKST